MSSSIPLPSILLVEDDEVFAAIAIEVLKPLGTVTWVATGEEAISVAPGGDWDLVVTDIELPGIDGIEFLKVVKAAHPRVAALVLSGRSSFDYAIAAIRANADDYMTKPVDPEALQEKATELIALTAARRVRRREVALAVGAHPDDVEIGCCRPLIG
jgi:DNA-binding response OmpR family regulator